jgi:hypothetical protein
LLAWTSSALSSTTCCASKHGPTCAGTHLRAHNDKDEVASRSYDTLNIMGIVTLGFMRARIGTVSAAKLAAGEGNPDFYRRKLILGNYWAEREMPQAKAALAAARAGAATLMALPAEAF